MCMPNMHAFQCIAMETGRNMYIYLQIVANKLLSITKIYMKQVVTNNRPCYLVSGHLLGVFQFGSLKFGQKILPYVLCRRNQPLTQIRLKSVWFAPCIQMQNSMVDNWLYMHAKENCYISCWHKNFKKPKSILHCQRDAFAYCSTLFKLGLVSFFFWMLILI